MKRDLGFLVENAIIEVLNNVVTNNDFIKTIFGEGELTDWGEIAMELDQIKRHYTFIEMEDIETSLLYWPSYNEGIANVLTQTVFSPYSKDTPIKEIFADLELNYDEYISGEGRWCWWGDDYVQFYKTFEELVKNWLADGDSSMEPDVEGTQEKIRHIGYPDLKKKAISITKTNKDPFDSLEELADSILDN